MGYDEEADVGDMLMIDWHVRHDGNDNNGGAYIKLYDNTTDYSGNPIPIVNDIGVTVNQNIVSRQNTFQPDMVGNGLHLRKVENGSFIDEWFIIEYATNDYVRLDREPTQIPGLWECWVGGSLKTIGGFGYAMDNFSSQYINDHYMFVKVHSGITTEIYNNNTNEPGGILIIYDPAKVVLYGYSSEFSDSFTATVTQTTTDEIQSMVSAHAGAVLHIRNIVFIAVNFACGCCVKNIEPLNQQSDFYGISCLNVAAHNATYGFYGCGCVQCSASGCEYGYETLEYNAQNTYAKFGTTILSEARNCSIYGIGTTAMQCIAYDCGIGYNLDRRAYLKNCVAYNCGVGVSGDESSMIIDTIIGECNTGISISSPHHAISLIRGCYTYNVNSNDVITLQDSIRTLSQNPFVDPVMRNFKLNEYGLLEMGGKAYSLYDVDDDLNVGAVQDNRGAGSRLYGSRSRRSIVI